MAANGKRSLRDLARTARFRAHTQLGRGPGPFFALHRALGNCEHLLVTAASELVVEGVPRVASTSCVFAVRLAGGRRLAIATHTHQPANVLRAVGLGVPVLVLIREPEAAIRATLVREPALSRRAVAERYVHFYRAVEKVRPAVAIADIAAVAADVGAAMGRVNATFGTNFATAPTDADAVIARIAEMETRSGIDPMRGYRPDPARAAARRLPALADDRLTRACRPCTSACRRWPGEWDGRRSMPRPRSADRRRSRRALPCRSAAD